MKFTILTFLILCTSLSLFAEISWTEHSIAENVIEPWQVFPADMDYDEDIDIVTVARGSGTLYWFEYLDYGIYSPNIISEDMPFAIATLAVDIDEDNDMDIFCASQAYGLILWVNDGDMNFDQQTIGSWPSASYIDTCDVDLDGDKDILVSCCENGSNRMGWVENLGDLQFQDHLVITNWIQANSVHAGDMDSDGDIDLIGTASGREGGDGEVSWFENINNQFDNKHDIFITTARPSCVKAVDLDEDGDMDAVASICQLDQIFFFENDGQQNFSSTAVSNGFSRALSIDVADLDDDGDIDIVAGSINNDKVAWLENDGSEDFTQHIITNQLDGAADVFIYDLDQDEDLDILVSGQYCNRIVWYEAEIQTNTEEVEIPLKEDLLNIYPNPFNPETTISFNFSYEQNEPYEQIELIIYNMKGQMIQKTDVILSFNRLGDGVEGRHTITWDGTDSNHIPVTSGIYFARLKAGEEIVVKKMMLLK
jgi:VCBS repeat protein/flagellar hook capping protein FlgD